MSVATGIDPILKGTFEHTELVFGLVGTVGTDLPTIAQFIKEELVQYGYKKTNVIQISKDVIPAVVEVSSYDANAPHERIFALMKAGNEARAKTNNQAILAFGAAARIYGQEEDDGFRPRAAYVLNSLKRPEEVSLLRLIYNEGFFLIGVYASESGRRKRLQSQNIPADKIDDLISRDEDDNEPYGQRTRDSFQMADFFVHADGQELHLKEQVKRIVRLIFGHPFTTPTFDEYAMFMAFSASLSSADLARQVGAIVARNEEILATGANDCPKSGGGRYWPTLSPKTYQVTDHPLGRDYLQKVDSNTKSKEELVQKIATALRLHITLEPSNLEEIIRESPIKEITEYGRSVHAEMEALLCCARNNISCRGATLYCTTFPCHNCARHIVSAGIRRVVYVEPYPKSRADQLHNDSIDFSCEPFSEESVAGEDAKVRLEHFVGVGPRRFFDLFSLRLGSGYPYERKQKDGTTVQWTEATARARLQMLPASYLEREKLATNCFSDVIKALKPGGEK